MEDHPVPRQITTFEFKLIGVLTIKQFVYLVIFTCLGVISFFIIPIPFLNIVVSAVTIFLGFVIVFVPFNERPIDTWIFNLIKRLTSPLQYYYYKKNAPPSFLEDVFVNSPPSLIEEHIDARQKLTSYISSQMPNQDQDRKKQSIHDLLYKGAGVEKEEMNKKKSPASGNGQEEKSKKTNSPFLFGTIKNNQAIPLPNILIYIKDKNNNILRILKTNSRGVFATFYPLPTDNYILETKDPDAKYFFDKMELLIEKNNQIPINIISRELL